MRPLVPIAGLVLCALTAAAPQEPISAATSFLDRKRDAGMEAALTWLADLRAEDRRYAFDEKEFLVVANRLRSYGYVPEAIRFLTKAVEFFPRSSGVWESLGFVHVRAGNKDQAIAAYDKAVELDPKNRGAQEQRKMIDTLLADARLETRARLEWEPGQNTGLKGPYLGQTPPGLKPELFAPGIVSVFGSNENTVTISPDGNELYFGKESGIWVCRLTDDGWTAPENTGFPGYEMWISPKSGRMYYTGYEPGIWVMERSGGSWGEPRRLVANGMFSTLTDDETLYTTVFSSRGKPNIGRYVNDGGAYAVAEVLGPEINSETGFDAHPNVAPDGSFLVFDSNRPGGTGLYVSFNNRDGSWTPARYLGEEFGGSLSTFSPDGQYLFFMKSRDIYWVSAKVIDRFRS